MAVLFGNYVQTTITGSVAASATTIPVTSTSGMPSAGGADYFYLTLFRVSDSALEVVKCTAIIGLNLTVVRAQDGTTALDLVNNDRCELWLNKGGLGDLRTESQARANHTGTQTASTISDFDTEVSNNTDVTANTTHKTSNGSDHTYIDQDVTSGSTPTFTGTNFSGIPDSALSNPEETLMVACSDETTDLTTGTAKITFRMPNYATTITGVGANVNTAPVGSTVTVDINEAGTTILSTKITIDASEKTSTTAATAPVISDSAIAADAEMTIDIDQIGSSTAGKGLKVWIDYKRA